MASITRWLFACALSIPGCDSGSSASTNKANDNQPASKPSGTAGPSLPLIVTDEVVRLAGARAILRLPEIPSGWTIVHKQNPMLTAVQLFRGSPKNFSAFVTLVFAPSAQGRTAEGFHAETVASLGPGLAPMVATGPAAATDLPGVFANAWSGTNPNGVAERAWLAVVVEDDEAVNVLVRSQAGIFDAEVLPMAKRLLTGLRLGGKVPRLGDKNPSERLSGVWEYKSGLDTEWISFDARGYAHLSSPDGPSDLDFDVRHALGERLYAYQLSREQIVLERFPPDPQEEVRRWSFARAGTALMIDNQEHRRVDDAKLELKPGIWEAYSAQSTGNAHTGSAGIAVDEHKYVLSADGTYTYSGGFSYSHNEMDAANPGNIDWTAAGYAAPEPAKGRWSVDGNALVLDDGKVVAKRTVLPSMHSPGKVVYISGRRFVKMD